MAKKIYKAFFTVTVFSVITRLLSFVFKIYLSRTLGAEAIGLFQICISVFMMLLCLSATGIPLYVSRKTAEIEKGGTMNKEEASVVTTSLIIGLSISVITLVVFLIFKNYLSFLFSDKRAIPLFLIMLPALLSSTIYSIIRGWFWGRKNFSVFSIMEFVEEILRIFFTVLLTCGLISGLSGETGLAIAFTVSDFVCVTVLVVIYFKKSGRLAKPTGFKNAFKTSAPITSMRIFGSMSNSVIALLLPLQLISFGLTTQEATAVYGQACGMAMPLLLIPSSIISPLAVILVPEIASMQSKKDTALLTRYSNSSISFAIVTAGLFLSLYAPIGSLYGWFLYNDLFAGQFVEATCVIMIPMAISGISSTVLNSIGLETKSFIVYVIGCFVLLLGILILPRFMGIYALSLSLLLCHTIIACLNLAVLKKSAGVSLAKITKPLICVCIFSLICFLLGKGLVNICTAYAGKITAMFTATIIVGLFYAALVYLFKLIDFKMIKFKR